jgi:NifU-like protein involved in Fe-S cluster formation
MDELVVKAYRKLCREGFEHTGEIHNPSIYLDTVGEKIRVCAHVSHAYIHVYISVKNNTIDDVKYLCTCDPATNVAIEILCALLKSKTLQEAEALGEKDFSKVLGSTGEEFLKKVRSIIELLHRGITRYKSEKH